MNFKIKNKIDYKMSIQSYSRSYSQSSIDSENKFKTIIKNIFDSRDELKIENDRLKIEVQSLKNIITDLEKRELVSNDQVIGPDIE